MNKYKISILSTIYLLGILFMFFTIGNQAHGLVILICYNSLFGALSSIFLSWKNNCMSALDKLMAFIISLIFGGIFILFLDTFSFLHIKE